ncbi:nuclear receptor subfamily 1 group I member 3 isoform X2 [Pteropus medius]|uniref:nuclear receptor subfamily 1 group I member 3 isoform X2 n=1 Tax=Pteropus vampyrus TaxID=132908 RepID=UPI00196A7D56|nr:nuclear receptor subfamily 1 group I member 3 isoform X2 [Pteropus giganteus]
MAGGEDELRNCVVCGDRATGYHFHALTCEGCKGFFRRTAVKSSGLACRFAGSCKISKAQRRHCPACRLQKCLDAGMKKDSESASSHPKNPQTISLLAPVLTVPSPHSEHMILSAEALALRRAKQAQRRAQRAPPGLSKEQKELVQTLLEAHARHMSTMFGQFVCFRQLPASLPMLPLLMHYADVNTFMVQQVIKFTKDLPFFRSLLIEDQISLLKGAAVEICHIALNTTFCLRTRNFFCGPLRYTEEDGALVGFQKEFLELIFRFHGTLRRLQLQEPEYVLMAAMALFSPDRPGVTQRDKIDQLQEEVALTLHSHLRSQQPRLRDRFLYAKLLGLLAELRSLNDAYGQQIQHIQELSAMMPLLQEICS